MYHQFGAVLVFIFVGLLFVFGCLIVGSFIRRKAAGEVKNAVYECGEPTVGSSWIRYNSRFYNVALVYLLFDVEVILLVPILLIYRERVSAGGGVAPLVLLLVFVALLVLGLAYEWFWGNLDWIRPGKMLEEGREGEN